MSNNLTTRSGHVGDIRASEDGKYIFPLSSEQPVRMWDGMEILVHTPSAVDLSWLNSGNAPLLDSHSRNELSNQIGVIRRAWLERKRVYVEVEFSNQSRAQEIKADVDADIIKNVSIGYSRDKIERDENSDEVRVIKWTPKEASFVPIPADVSVGMGRSANMEGHMTTGNQNTSSARGDDNPAAPLPGLSEQERGEALSSALTEIGTLAAEHNMSDLGRSYVNGCLSRGDTPSIEAFRYVVKAKLPEGTPLRNEDIGLTTKERKRFSLHKFILATEPGAQRSDIENAKFELEAVEAAGAANCDNARHKMPTDIMRNFDDFEVDGVNYREAMSVRNPLGVTGGLAGTALQPNPNVQDVNHLAGRFIDNLRNRLVLGRLGITVIDGLTGNIEIPGADANSQAFWLGSEDADAAETTPTFRKIEMAIKTIANYTDMSRNFLLQSTIAAEAYTRMQLLDAVAEGIDLAGWYGTGAAGQPTGLANTAGIGSVTFAAAVPNRNELIDMDTAIANTNNPASPTFVTNTALVGALRKAPIDAGSGLFLMRNDGTLEIGNSVERSNQITSGDVFSGVFSDMIMAQWGSLEFGRSTEAKFLSGGIRIRAMMSLDFGVRRVGSFVLGNDGI